MSTNNSIAEAEARVDSTAKTVAEWRSNCQAIESKIADAKQRVIEMQGSRREHALSAALDRAPAARALASAHTDQAAAEKLADDLEYALAQANARLAEAEVAHNVAALALSRALARGVIERRILAAEKVDIACAQLESALASYDTAWSEISGINLGEMMSVSTMEIRRGERRVQMLLQSVIPAELRRQLGLPGGSRGSLAASERLAWRGLA